MNTYQPNENVNKNKYVLVVDDITANLQVVGSILKEKGLKVAFAQNGEQALSAALKKPPDLILLDIQMPGMDGFAVCEKLKNDPLTKAIPIIFLTAKSQTDDIIRGFQIGAVDYIKKPFNTYELLARVFTHLELKGSHDKILEQKEELEIKNKKLEELIDKQNEFSGMAAHDLRNPLSTISIYVDMMYSQLEKKHFIAEKGMNYLSKIRVSTQRMTHLISDLLNISAIESGKINLSITKENIFDLLNDNIEIFKQIANEKNIQINFNKDDHSPIVEVMMDKLRIIQVIENLLSNAIKYTFPNGKINVFYEKTDTKFITHVKDTGQGLDDDDFIDLFTSFKKLSSKPTGGESSTGLGLAIVKKIIDLHEGEIWVDSKKGEGSTFSFSLNLAIQ